MAKGPRDHLDALGGVEVEGGRLALAVRVGGRDAVGDELDAAHAEGRARAEAAHRDLQVLGIVLDGSDHQAGHAGERLGGVHAEVAGLVGAQVDRIDRVGQRSKLSVAVGAPVTTTGLSATASASAGAACCAPARQAKPASAPGTPRRSRAASLFARGRAWSVLAVFKGATTGPLGAAGDCAMFGFHGRTPRRA